MFKRLRWVVCSLLLCVGLCSLSPTSVSASGGVAMFVSGVQASDARAALWVDGVFFQALRTRLRSTEQILGGIPSAQQTALQQASSAFKAGKKAFDDLSPDSAFRNFRNAMRHLEAAVPYNRDYSLVAKCWIYLGVSYLLNGKKGKGLAAFRRGLLINPSFLIKQVTKDGTKIGLFEQVRTELRKETKAMLSVNAKLTGSVYVNGRFVGLSPVKIQVPKGTHYVVVRRPGYRWWGKLVAVSGAGFSLTATMARRPAFGGWRTAGTAAVVHTLKRGDMPTEVAAFASLTKSTTLVLARVRVLKGGKLAIQAAAYDVASQKQLGAGGALISWKPTPAGQTTVAGMVSGLLQGRQVALGGWTPKSLNVAAPGGASGGGGKGLAIGLGVGIGLLAAGGAAVLIIYLVKPELLGGTPNCPSGGACISLTIK